MFLNIRSLLLLTLIYGPNAGVEAVDAPPPENRLEEIVVSGAFEGRKLGTAILGTTILNKEAIQRQLDGSIGETLRRQPGISSTFFGPGASRPIIRGLGGDRIRILDSGLGSIDASSTSPDHATAIEPALAERIEILRGTAMLMYGSSAAGGVVNVMDGRIPNSAPENTFDGAVRYGHTTVNEGDEIVGAFNAQLGKVGGTTVIFHGDALYRATSDYKIPGFGESKQLRDAEAAEAEASGEAPEEEVFGIAENSETKTTGASAGLSFLFSNGFIGMNVKLLDSSYGVPGGHEHDHDAHDDEHDDAHDDDDDDHEGTEEAPVTIELDQIRYDLRGEIKGDYGFFKKIKIRFGYADYEHLELEGNEVETVFSNEGWEGRLDFIHNGNDTWGGASGIQVKSRDFSAIGEEAFVPATISKEYGFYTVKEFKRGPWQIDVGGRFEHTSYEATEVGEDRSFNGFSLSAGSGYQLSESAFVALAVSRTERAPSTEELFFDGPHLATNSYELGDVTLGLETALGLEATFSYATQDISFIVNAFITSYEDFIFEEETGDVIGNLDLYQFTASDAKLYGFESKVEVHATSFQTKNFGAIDVHLDGQLDLVRAELDIVGNDRLPRIPPMSALVGAEMRADQFNFRVEIEYAAEQNRVAAQETPTDDYLLWNMYLTLRPFSDKNIALDFKGTNLGNSEARQHTSFLKDNVPLPGRNLKASISVLF